MFLFNRRNQVKTVDKEALDATPVYECEECGALIKTTAHTILRLRISLDPCDGLRGERTALHYCKDCIRKSGAPPDAIIELPFELTVRLQAERDRYKVTSLKQFCGPELLRGK